jgi:hypothetical protein
MKSNNTTKVPLSPRELQAVNHILITWGMFTLLELGGDLNFLPKNALEILSQLGIKINTKDRQRQWPTIAEHADRLIAQLSKYKPRLADTVKWHYLQDGTIRNKAKQYGLHKSTYHERLTKGERWIAQQL